MTLRPCSAIIDGKPCGRTPTLNEQHLGVTHSIQLECRCGRHTAFVLYTWAHERAQCLQAVQDGWNSADH